MTKQISTSVSLRRAPHLEPELWQHLALGWEDKHTEPEELRKTALIISTASMVHSVVDSPKNWKIAEMKCINAKKNDVEQFTSNNLRKPIRHSISWATCIEGELLILVHRFHGAMFSQVGPWSSNPNLPGFRPASLGFLSLLQARLVAGKIRKHHRKLWFSHPTVRVFSRFSPQIKGKSWQCPTAPKSPLSRPP